MAVLIGIQRPNGDWESYVLTRYPNPITGAIDVLGRVLPEWRYVEAYDGLPRGEAGRIARLLQGIPRPRRHEAFRERASGLRLMARGGTFQ